MRFELVTLFPEVRESLRIGLLGKAIDEEKLEVVTFDPRTLATDKHRSVDDAPYGGGSGMVMMPGPLVGALEALDAQRSGPSHKVLMSPRGTRFDQRLAERFATLPSLTLVCGRYEGIDERVRSFVDEEVSLGDFVLLGGEAAALTIVEATARLLPGVLGNRQSAVDESHSTGLLEYPQYTRPAEFRGVGVPDILRSGHHAAIERWRRREALRVTRERRPDLLVSLSASDMELLAEIDAEAEA